ncbi:MAG: hypothetical protein FH753_16930 [Firmicutes bacterium]|nr:hypothetical protein [Bacillota bacterium]
MENQRRRIMKKNIVTILLIILILTSFSQTALCDNKNPTRKELERRIEMVAKKRGIPSVLLKTIARVESVYKHYNSDGSVYTGSRGSIGLMQINNRSAGFNTDKLKYDIDYNIEAGAEMLLRKWSMANKYLPKIGDMNPNVLENWYFALWAYNGWAKSNNPNMNIKKHTYPELIYLIAENEYDQKITPLDKKLLPKSGLPSKTNHYKTPKNYHTGDILMYKKGDIAKVDVNSSLRVRKSPNGSVIGSFSTDETITILKGPTLKEGYFWYKAKNSENLTGWVVGNWIVKTGEKKLAYKDIYNHWAKEYIEKLKSKDVLEESKNIRPNDYITREEFSVYLAKALNMKKVEYKLTYDDIDKVDNENIEYLESVCKKGYIKGFNEKFKPKYNLKRQEVAIILNRVLGNENIDIKLPYKDKEKISEWALDSVKYVYSKNIMKGKENNYFKPNEFLTRAEAFKVITDIMNLVKKAA